jgi:predicted amidohydrolase YtcJ
MSRKASLLAATVVILLTPPVAEGCRENEMKMPGERTDIEAVFYNGRIYTLDPDIEQTVAIAVGGGRIIDIGPSDELLAAAGTEVARYDIGGHAVLPGLTDAHAHFSGYALQLARLDLVSTGSIDEVAELVRNKVESAGVGVWIEGRGWDQNDWEDKSFPDRSNIDPVSSQNPVYLVRVCGHAALANSEALRLAGIDRTTPDPQGGVIERGEDGEPTGILIDNAKELVKSVIPVPSIEEKKHLFAEAARRCLAAGLTGVHEMGIDGETAAIYRDMYSDGELPFRITAYIDGDADDFEELLATGPYTGFAGDRFSIVGVKFYMDGSLGARSAALLEDYSDDPGNRGILVADPEELRQRIAEYQLMGYQSAIHAIGDRAVRIVLDIYESTPDMRHRIEHAQVVSAADIARFSKLGVVPSMQFTHCTSDMPWAEDRLGPERIQGAYAWRSFLDTGCRVPGGSDFPVESIDPFLGIYAAVTRADRSGRPAGGWMPGQKLTVEEAVRAFTIDAAWAAGMDDTAGSLSPGKLADFIVISPDIMRSPPEAIPETKVLATILGGEIVHRAEDAPF